MIAIIGAMEQEMSFLQQKLASQNEHQKGPFLFYTGKLEGQDVVLLRCGIGKVNAAVGCVLLLEQFQPHAVINTGSAGGLNPQHTFGDLVISTEVIYHDVDVTAFGYALGQLPQHPPRFHADLGLVAAAEAAINNLKHNMELPASLNYTRGLVGSGDVFVHQPDLITHMLKNFPELCAVEMEGAAIAHTCWLFQTPFVIIRALSDIAGRESPMKFDEFLPLASQRSAQIILEMLRHALSMKKSY